MDKETTVKVVDSRIELGGVVILAGQTGMMTIKKSEAWRLYLAMQSYFAQQPRNMRKGNTCPDCNPPRQIDDRAERCRNHRVRKGKGDETANTE